MSDPKHSSSQPSDRWLVKSTDAAVAAAIAVIGASPPCAGATARLMTVQDTTTPFVGRSINADNVWVVSLPSVRLSIDSDPKIELPQWDYTVTILPTNGEVGSIVTAWPQRPPDVLPPPPAEDAERQMLACGGERWMGLLRCPPSRSLRSVLATVQDNSGEVAGAKQIIAHVVRWKMETPSTAADAWSVDLRGIPAIAESRASWDGVAFKLDPNQVNHRRHIIFDRDGVWFTSTTTPQPEMRRTR